MEQSHYGDIVTSNRKKIGHIEPGILYEYKQLAELLGISHEQLKKHYLKTDRVEYVPAGYTYWILGSAMIRAVSEFQQLWSSESHKGPAWPKQHENNQSQNCSQPE